jgi:hypothetical protein
MAGVGLETDEVGAQHSVKNFFAACGLGSVFFFLAGGRRRKRKDGWRVKRMRGEEGKLKGDVNLRTREWHQDEKTDNPVV